MSCPTRYTHFYCSFFNFALVFVIVVKNFHPNQLPRSPFPPPTSPSPQPLISRHPLEAKLFRLHPPHQMSSSTSYLYCFKHSWGQNYWNKGNSRRWRVLISSPRKLLFSHFSHSPPPSSRLRWHSSYLFVGAVFRAPRVSLYALTNRTFTPPPSVLFRYFSTNFSLTIKYLNIHLQENDERVKEEDKNMRKMKREYFETIYKTLFALINWGTDFWTGRS